MHIRSLVIVAALATGCSSSPSTSTRTVTGQLGSGATVMAQSADRQQFTGSVSAGRFALQLPTGQSYQLLVGTHNILWPTTSGAARWARLGAGATLDLGHVSRRGDGDYDCDHHAGGDDHCDKDDGDDRDGGDHDGDRDGGRWGGDDDDHDDGGDHDGHACDGGAQAGGGGGGADLGGIR